MALNNITNARMYQRAPTNRVDTATLNKYFNDYVPVEKEKTTLIREEILSDLNAILDYVHNQDNHFGKTGIRVGSSTQGLSVNVKSDVDCSVVFKLSPSEGQDHWSNKLIWGYSTPRHYGYQGPMQNDNSSLHPGLGHVKVGGCDKIPGLAEFVFSGDLIPSRVQSKFKRLLQEATKYLGLQGDLKLSKIVHGPALTFTAEVKTSDGKTHPVSIDLAVVIHARIPFLPEMGWPVVGKLWPPPDKIESIRKMGINDVAKESSYWQLSFAELEKELVREIDIDGGCRKKVHRVMKSVYYTVCKTNVALSSYMLKNVWFLELERYWNPQSWHQDCLSNRYYGCLDSLQRYVNGCFLPQYFDRRINLLKKDKIPDIRNDVLKIQSFPFPAVNSRKRQTEDVYTPQPSKLFRASK